MKKAILVFLILALVCAASGKDKKKVQNEEPTPWGLLSQHTGCVIFKESRKTTGRFWGVAVTTKTFSVLEVIETQNYKLEPAKWDETQENLNELQRRGMKDKVKFVKIPDGYSPAQLEKAKAMCSEGAAATLDAEKK